MGLVNLPSNPTVRIGTNLGGGGYPSKTRDYYTRIIFRESNFLIYKDNEDCNNIRIDGDEEHTFYLRTFGDVNGQPAHVSDENYGTAGRRGLKDSPSAFVTPVNSVLPKLVVPSTNDWTDNGCDNLEDHEKGVFNWKILNEFPEMRKEAKVSPAVPRHFSLTHKNESSNADEVQMALVRSEEPGYIAGGAFCIMLGVTPTAQRRMSKEDQRGWNIRLTFGDVTLDLNDSGLFVDISESVTKCQLAQARSSEAPPQFGRLKDSNPYVLVVYPLWNGIVVSNGVQDVPNNVAISSQYCPKVTGVNVLQYIDDFDTKSPQSIQAQDQIVNLGTELRLTARNCQIQGAYLPLFFGKQGKWDDLFVGQIGNEDQGITYSYNAYPIWADNGAGSSIQPQEASVAQEGDDEIEWKVFNWEVQSDDPVEGRGRYAAELLGYLMRTRETTRIEVKNATGSFAGLPGSWEEHITNVSVTVGIDGSSGTITVDKYGATSGDLTVPATQSIGGIRVFVNASQGGGEVFAGLAYGVGDNISYDGGGWTVNLVGLEKKLEEMILLNVPFFDGEETMKVIDFLCSYAGVRYRGNVRGQQPSSQDFQNPVVDFKTGTTVLEALREACSNVNAGFHIEGGYVVFYNYDDLGYPKTGIGKNIELPDNVTMNLDYTPDFEDLRNEIILFSLRQLNSTNIDYTKVNLLPEITQDKITTTPNIPWSKPMFTGLNGYLSSAELERMARLKRGDATRYDIYGRTTIPGDATIRLFDKWGEYFVHSYTHNIDLQAKTFTTDLSFAGNG